MRNLPKKTEPKPIHRIVIMQTNYLLASLIAVLSLAPMVEAQTQEEYYRITPVPTPKDVVLEVGAFEFMPESVEQKQQLEELAVHLKELTGQGEEEERIGREIAAGLGLMADSNEFTPAEIAALGQLELRKLVMTTSWPVDVGCTGS